MNGYEVFSMDTSTRRGEGPGDSITESARYNQLGTITIFCWLEGST